MRSESDDGAELEKFLRADVVDDAATLKVYDRVLKIVRLLAPRYSIVDESEIEDIAIEIVQLLRTSRGDIPNHVNAYLSSAIRNRMAERTRRLVREEYVLTELKRNEEIRARENATSFVDPLDRQEMVRRVQEAMSQLSDRERGLLLMRFTEDLSTREIAERLAEPSDYVRVRVYRALQKLRKVLLEREV